MHDIPAASQSVPAEIEEVIRGSLHPEGTTDADIDPSSIIDIGVMQVAYRSDADKEKFLAALKRALNSPGEFSDVDGARMKEGPSYIELGAWLGDQRLALLFMALGQHHGVWKVMTPSDMGIDREDAMWGDLAGRGMIMVGNFDLEALGA